MNLRPTLILALAVLLLSAAGASAGTYHVVACDAAPDGASNNAWTYGESAAGRFEHGDGCSGAQGTEYAGLFVREDLTQNSNIPVGTNAYWTFQAPAATTITGFQYSRHLRTYLDDGWRAELRADGTVLEDCVVPSDSDECDRGDVGGTATAFSGLSASQLQFGARCTPISPATSCTDGSSLQRVTATAYGLDVTITDPDAPVVSDLGGTIVGGGWLRGAQSVSSRARDASGIDRLELVRDAATVLTDDRSCDYTLPAPCSSPGADTAASWASVDTTTWPDGNHAIAARASDAAGTTASTPTVTVQIDNTPPTPPTVAADDSWSRAADARWTWTVPEEADRAPIDRVEVETCHADSCAVDTVSSDAGSHTFTRVVDDGTTSVRIRHRDLAGNQGEWSAPAIARRDRTAPPAPTLGTPTRAGSGRYRVNVDTADPGPAPLAGLAGKACSVKTSSCRTLTAHSLAEMVSPKLAPGRWGLRVHAVDAAGNAGPDGEANITVPRRRPELKLTKVRATRTRVIARGTVARSATGRIRVDLVAGAVKRSRTARVRKGTFRVTFTRPLTAVHRLRLRARYGGDMTYRPAHRSRTLRVGPVHSGAGADPSAPPSLSQPR